MVMVMVIKAGFSGAHDTLGDIDPLDQLVPYRPSPEPLLSSIKALGLRLACITNLPDNATAEPPPQHEEQIATNAALAVLDEQRPRRPRTTSTATSTATFGTWATPSTTALAMSTPTIGSASTSRRIRIALESSRLVADSPEAVPVAANRFVFRDLSIVRSS